EAVRFENGRKLLGGVVAQSFVKRVVFEFDIKPCAFAYKLNRFFESRNALSDVARICCERISAIEPRACVELFDLCEREINRVPSATRLARFFDIAHGRAVWEDFCDVRRA